MNHLMLSTVAENGMRIGAVVSPVENAKWRAEVTVDAAVMACGHFDTYERASSWAEGMHGVYMGAHRVHRAFPADQ